jgi:hypothetical protein
MKKPFAAFTIVKDEPVNLPIWLKHYRRTFADEDIYVIDHDTQDGSTDNLGVTVIPVHNPEAFRHQWLVDQVQRVQAELLERYEVVLFAEADEMVYAPHAELIEVLEAFRKSDSQFTNVVGYEAIHVMDEQPKLDRTIPIVKQRPLWYRETHMDKPLITKIPLTYGAGFHHCQYSRMYDWNLFMFHLHRMDYDLMLERHIWRNTKWNLVDEGGLGWHHHIYEANAVRDLMQRGWNGSGDLEQIPEQHQERLMHL